MPELTAEGLAAAARAGDREAFSALAERHRRELQLHCYRMLGSFEDSEDLVQETFLRAWRKRATYAARSSFRAWLYGIATNACLDALERRRRPAVVSGEEGEAPWLQPFPDRLLEELASDDRGPEAEVVAKETVELAFVAALQLLPPRQRAALIARDVLDFSAAESASVLGMSVPAANSALQRARARLRERAPRTRSAWVPGSVLGDDERDLLRRYMDATDRADPAGLLETLREDASFSMPPAPGRWVGRETMVEAWVDGGFGSPSFGSFRALLVGANGQPAVANYLRAPGDEAHRAFAVDVLRIEDGAVAVITTFPLAPLVDAFGLPRSL